jgi:RNase P/RNase MRP subunit p29
MRNRTKAAIDPTRDTRARRVGLPAWALATLVSAWVGAADAVLADTFVLRGGEPIEGAIVQATRNTLVIRRAIGGMHQMSIQGIEEVRIDLAQGEWISGRLLGWAEGVYQIRSGSEVVRIREGIILSRAPIEAEPSQTPPPQPRETRTVETAAAPVAFAVQTMDSKGVAANGSHAAIPTAETAAARAAKSESQTVALNASVDPAEAGTAGMVFNIELSRPAEQTIVLIYGTVDGTARAGTDYEPQQGVITLAPGTRSAQVRVPLIDRGIPRNDARFELFLTADPRVVQVVDQRVTAVIPGQQ